MRPSGRQWLALGVCVGIVILAAYAYTIAERPNTAPDTGTCTVTDPHAGWHYWVIYDVANGSVTFVSGGSSTQVQSTNLTSGQAVLNITSNQTQVHQIMCDATMGHLNFWHVNLSTLELVRTE
jgi:hypothetical protein